MNIIPANIRMLRMKEKLLNNKLTKGDVSKNIQFICENADTYLKIEILDNFPDLSVGERDIIGLSVSADDKNFMEFFKYVNINMFSEPVENYLVEEYLRYNFMSHGDGNLNIDYEDYINLKSSSIKMIVEAVCQSKKKQLLFDLLISYIFAPYYDYIFEVYSQIENIQYGDIQELSFGKLSKNNKDKYVEIVCKESAAVICDFAIDNAENLDSDHIDKIANELCIRMDAKCMYKFAINIESISKDNISTLAKAILNTNDIEYIYLFLKNVSNINDDDRKLLKSKILKSCNMKFICLVAIYIDAKLIKKLFDSKKQMYRYVVASNLFNENELLDISKKMFGGSIDTNQIESQVQKELIEINIKRYKLQRQEKLNKKGNKKDNK